MMMIYWNKRKQQNKKLHQQRTDLSKTNSEVNNIKKDLINLEERIANACYEILVNTLEGSVWEYRESRRGAKVTVQPNSSFIQLVKLLMFQLTNKIFLLCTLYRLTMLLLYQFTRRRVRSTFNSNRRKLANKKATDLLDLDLESDDYIFISESLHAV